MFIEAAASLVLVVSLVVVAIRAALVTAKEDFLFCVCSASVLTLIFTFQPFSFLMSSAFSFVVFDEIGIG